jgi:glycine amidinotransferase
MTRGGELFANNGWQLITPPRSVRDELDWVGINLLMLDERTAIVEASETPLIEFLESLECRVIRCALDAVFQFGGSVHCVTCDIRRRGELQSYFPAFDE